MKINSGCKTFSKAVNLFENEFETTRNQTCTDAVKSDRLIKIDRMTTPRKHIAPNMITPAQLKTLSNETLLQLHHLIVDEMEKRMITTTTTATHASAAASSDHANYHVRCDEIDTFYKKSSRAQNGAANKTRETIIHYIQSVPDEYKTDPVYGEKWTSLCEAWDKTVTELVTRTGVPKIYTSMKIQYLAGLGNHHDFELLFYTGETEVAVRKIEFKYGAKNISKLPQFLSLRMNGAFFGEAPTYDMFYYDNYLDKYVACDDGITEPKPSRDKYRTCMTKIKYDCDPFIQQLYDREVHHKNEKADVVNESIRDYLEKYGSHLQIEQFIGKRNESQEDKWYILWMDGAFHIDHLQHSAELAYSGVKGGNTIQLVEQGGCYNLLLRWRNHKGILGPAWQVRYERIVSK